MTLLASFVPILGITIVIGLVIFFIIKRVNDKDKENFEKRDN